MRPLFPHLHRISHHGAHDNLHAHANFGVVLSCLSKPTGMWRPWQARASPRWMPPTTAASSSTAMGCPREPARGRHTGRRQSLSQAALRRPIGQGGTSARVSSESPPMSCLRLPRLTSKGPRGFFCALTKEWSHGAAEDRSKTLDANQPHGFQRRMPCSVFEGRPNSFCQFYITKTGGRNSGQLTNF